MMTSDADRPFVVTLLALCVLFLTVFSAVRLGTALAQWDILQMYMPRPGPLYIALTGLVWTLGWLTVFQGLWRGLMWAYRGTLVVAGSYAVYYWIDRWFYQSVVARSNTVFSVGMTIFLLLSTAFAVNMPGSRKYFRQREYHDR
ncbi:MAG: hypothetical protein L3J16_05525 [Anaerolineales bacterium]|nr:hypothetical protein [Anaerolineales bacterium]